MSSLAASTSLADAQPPIALGALDGRYRGAVAPLVDHLSEPALNRARVHVEVEWLVYLTSHSLLGSAPLDDADVAALRAWAANFGQAEIDELAQTERTTQHDVKAVEYLVRAQLSRQGLDRIAELTHVACTSEDINNLSYAITVKQAVAEVWQPKFEAVIAEIARQAEQYRELPMMSRTHGQPATPTTLGKELAVFVHRLNRQLAQITQIEYLGKFSGATGTFAAHIAADPLVDW